MAGSYEATEMTFGSIEGLANTVRELDETYTAEKETDSDAKVLCMIEDGDEWLQDHDRAPLVVYEDEHPVNAAAVSKHDKYYEPVQFHEPFEALVEAVRQQEVDVNGSVTVGKYSKRLTGEVEFHGETVQDPTGNEVELGLQISTAHNGFHAVSVEVGAERLVCSNGMTAWQSEFSFTHDHNQGPFRPDMMYQAVDSVLHGGDVVQQRFNNAYAQTLESRDEMILLLLDCGIEWLFDDPMEAMHSAFEKEVSWHENPQQMRESPSLYDAYCVGTYAIDHLATDDTSREAVRSARQRLSQLLETYDGDVPNAREMVEQTVNTRVDALTAGGNERWEGEQELVQQVA